MKDAITLLLSLFVGICFGTILTRSCNLKQTEIPQADTVTVVKIDTVTHYKPVPVKVTTLGEYSFDKYTPYAFFTDTVETVIYKQGQTFYHEVKEYGDSTYYAKISGINANLEEWETYPKTVTKYITVPKEVQGKAKRFGIGPGVGVSLVDNKIKPSISFVFSWHIIQW